MPRPTHAAGFTLTELIITLAVATILGMLGAPALGSLMAHTRDANAEASVAATLRHARSASVMRDVRVLVCPSRNGQHCRPGDDWQHGWLVAEDSDRDGQPDHDTEIIATQAAMPGGTRIITSTGRKQIIFHPNGNAAGSNVRFTICHVRTGNGLSVIVANSGRIRVEGAARDRLRTCLAGVTGAENR